MLPQVTPENLRTVSVNTAMEDLYYFPENSFNRDGKINSDATSLNLICHFSMLIRGILYFSFVLGVRITPRMTHHYYFYYVSEILSLRHMRNQYVRCTCNMRYTYQKMPQKKPKTTKPKNYNKQDERKQTKKLLCGNFFLLTEKRSK